MVMLQVDNEVASPEEINTAAGSRMALELREIVGEEPGLAPATQHKRAHWVYSVPAPGVRFYTYD